MKQRAKREVFLLISPHSGEGDELFRVEISDGQIRDMQRRPAYCAEIFRRLKPQLAAATGNENNECDLLVMLEGQPLTPTNTATVVHGRHLLH